MINNKFKRIVTDRRRIKFVDVKMLFDRAEIDKASVVSFEILAIIFYGGRRGNHGCFGMATRYLSRRQMNRDYF